MNLTESISRLTISFKRDGLLNTATKVFHYFRHRRARIRFTNAVLSLTSPEERFTWIYKENYWKSRESASGTGSTLRYTENLRKCLPGIMRKYSIRKVFDAPCGDFNWMKHLLSTVDVEYLGGDIVRPLVEENNRRYKSANIAFIQIDLANDDLPRSDLMICRDCLFHLSFKDTRLVLESFIRSETDYLLTTTHVNSLSGGFSNIDIETGDYRRIDLFSHPYNFPRNYLEAIEDWVEPGPERLMCLWNRHQVAEALLLFKLT